VTARERTADRARLRAREQLGRLARELRDARLSSGRSQREVARASGMSTSRLSRIELGRIEAEWFEAMAVVAAVLGRDISLRTYPGDHGLRDEPQVRLLARFRDRLRAGWAWRYEVPIAPADQRAWDALARHTRSGTTILVEAETRMGDVQALLRRLALKRDASPRSRLVLLVTDSRANRDAIAIAADELATEFPIQTRGALRRLMTGSDPGGDCLVVLGSPRLGSGERPVLGGAKQG
jgi:transcriptional regulator with XRE-family HTH domain